MSYSYLGTFVDVKNHRKIITADISRLKSLNQYAYKCDLKDICPTGKAKDEDYPDITTDILYEFVSYYDREKLFKSGIKINIQPYRKKEWNKTKDAFYVTEEEYEKYKEAMEPYAVNPSLEELKTFDEDDKGIIILYKRYKKKNDGQWYRAADFEKVEKALKDTYQSKVLELHELKKLRNTKDWFEMSEEAKNSYLEEVSYLESAIEEEYEPEYEAVEYILSIFSFLEEEGLPVPNEFGEISYEWSYDDNREIELYIEVC